MSLLKTIIIAIVVIILLIWIISLFTGDSTKLTGLTDATEEQKISGDSLPSDSSTNNYTYSVWLYVQDWNYKYGEVKHVLTRSPIKPSPSITLGATENDLDIKVTCYRQDSGSSSGNDNTITHTCNIKNIPLQKWVNAIISLYGRSLDVYIDGKLVRTCVLPGVAKIDTSSTIYVTPLGGFSGWTSNIRYWNTAKNPQEAYNIYKSGYGSSFSIGNLFNKYRIKVAFLDDNVEKGSFEI
jgi:hypothetical protein